MSKKQQPVEPRREALKIIGAIGSTCIFPFQSAELYGQHQHEEGQPQTYQRQLFNEAEFTNLSAFVDVIIPATDTPSASAAGVPAYIDYVAANNKKLAATLRGGLAMLERKKFVRMKPAARERLAQQMCDAAEKAKTKTAQSAFWTTVKNLTADGYYTSKVGLRDELGYKGNTVLEAFPSCDTVPEH